MSTEGDRLKWRGIRLAAGENSLPVHEVGCVGTQVKKSAQATNETTILHTVTAEKTLCLAAVALTGCGDGSGIMQMTVRNDTDVFQFYIFCLAFIIKSPAFATLSFSPHMDIPAGWDIYIVSDDVDVTATGFLFGQEQDV